MIHADIKMLEEGSFYKEPVGQCPRCENAVHAEWVDIGFGPYTQQAGPFHCYACGWTEAGCPAEYCLGPRCTSWEYCKGEAIEPERRWKPEAGVAENEH